MLMSLVANSASGDTCSDITGAPAYTPDAIKKMAERPQEQTLEVVHRARSHQMGVLRR
jgi:hypothetical protein